MSISKRALFNLISEVLDGNVSDDIAAQLTEDLVYQIGEEFGDDVDFDDDEEPYTGPGGR